MPEFETLLRARLSERKQQDRWRELQELEGAQAALVSRGGRSYLNFCSNDYLGLASDPRVIGALKQGADNFGVGSGASHLICGHSSAHRELEDALAAFCGRERALLFSTGYMANLGVVQALVSRGDSVIEDRLNHASLLDAAVLSRAKMLRFQHADTHSLEQQLQRAGDGSKLVLTDGVFSMDGDIAPLKAIAALCRKNDAWLMVDDAHGFGVLGQSGAGAVEQLGLSQADVPVLVGTLGKAFGTSGAFVAGSKLLIESLIQFARTYIYTTAMSPAIASATLESLRIVESETWRREKLSSLIALFRQGCEAHGLQLMRSKTAIQPLLVGSESHAVALSDTLREKGVWVSAIRPPTVPENQSRLRITLTANHSEEQVETLVDALVESYKNLGVDDV